MGNQVTSIMTWYPTHSQYPDSESTSACHFLIMQSVWRGSGKYVVLNHWFHATRIPTHRFESHDLPKWEMGAELFRPSDVQSQEKWNSLCKVIENVSFTFIGNIVLSDLAGLGWDLLGLAWSDLALDIFDWLAWTCLRLARLTMAGYFKGTNKSLLFSSNYQFIVRLRLGEV